MADDREEIADEVRRFAAAYDYVLTTGGVGFTHDDVTMEGESFTSLYTSSMNSLGQLRAN